MRIKFFLENEKSKIVLPISYQQKLQAMIYKNLSPRIAEFIHDKGFLFEKRSFKMFCFSRIFGKHRINEKTKEIEFFSPISFYLSTPYTILAEDFTENIIKTENIKLGRTNLYLSSVEVFTKKIIKEELFIKMLSPLTMYSTFNKQSGEKITYYYTPFDKEFGELIKRNIIKKHKAFFDRDIEDKDFEIEPYIVSERKNLNIIYYKKILIKAWTGIYRLKGNRELLEFSYNSGIGAKNSQGFGMWEEWQQYNKKHT